jgi:hypothetical protein
VFAQPAAGSVLEMDGAFHQGTFFAFSLFGKLLLLFLSGCGSLADGRLGSGSNSPDKSRQFTSNRSNDLSLGLPAAPSFISSYSACAGGVEPSKPA